MSDVDKIAELFRLREAALAVPSRNGAQDVLTLCLGIAETQAGARRGVSCVGRLLGVKLRDKTRAWLQRRLSSLRVYG